MWTFLQDSSTAVPRACGCGKSIPSHRQVQEEHSGSLCHGAAPVTWEEEGEGAQQGGSYGGELGSGYRPAECPASAGAEGRQWREGRSECVPKTPRQSHCVHMRWGGTRAHPSAFPGDRRRNCQLASLSRAASLRSTVAPRTQKLPLLPDTGALRSGGQKQHPSVQSSSCKPRVPTPLSPLNFLQEKPGTRVWQESPAAAGLQAPETQSPASLTLSCKGTPRHQGSLEMPGQVLLRSGSSACNRDGRRTQSRSRGDSRVPEMSATTLRAEQSRLWDRTGVSGASTWREWTPPRVPAEARPGRPRHSPPVPFPGHRRQGKRMPSVHCLSVLWHRRPSYACDGPRWQGKGT